MNIKFVLADSQPFQLLGEINATQAPLPNENVSIGPRVYRVMERSWRFDFAMHTPAYTPDNSIGLLLTQVGGPPHVIISGAQPLIGSMQ